MIFARILGCPCVIPVEGFSRNINAYSASCVNQEENRMFRLNHIIGTCILVTAFLPTISAHAATYYVSPTGNDAYTCTQAKYGSTPKKTIPAGVKCLVGGDTLIIKAGKYIGQQIYNPPTGSASAYTVIKGDPAGARPILDPNGQSYQMGFLCDRGAACRYIEIRHLEITTPYAGIKLTGPTTLGYPHHVRIIDNVIHDTVGSAFSTGTSDTGYVGGDHLIQGNEFYNIGIGTPYYAPGVNTIYNPGNRTIVEKNKFHHLANGIGVWYANKLIQNVTIRSNVFYDIGRTSINPWQKGTYNYSGVHVSVPGGGHKIYNNIIYRSGDEAGFGGIKISKANSSDSNQIYNNTIHDIKNSSASAIKITASTGTHLVKNNIAYLAGKGISGGSQSNNLNTNPSFYNAAKGDFRVLSGSAAIDKGVILTQVPIDFAGAQRPAGSSHDIGVYETGASSALAAPTSLSAQ